MLGRICALGVLLFTSSVAADEAVVFIVNRSNPIQSISLQELITIYSGQKRRWPDGQNICAINRPVSASVRATVFRVLFNAGPGKEFSISGSPTSFRPVTRQSGRSVKQLVSQVPNAIGYILVSEVDDRVKVLTVDGIEPNDTGYFPSVQGRKSSQ